MTNIKMLLAEIRYRKLNFVLSLLAITMAAALFVTGPSLIEGYGKQTDEEMAKLEDQTRKLMLNMGFNLLIMNRDTDMSNFWASDFASADMPQDYVQRLADAKDLKYVAHLVATLQKKIDWNDRKVLLVGYNPETAQSHRGKKKPMGYVIEPGKVKLGHELGAGHKPGETIEVLGKQLEIDEILPERGSKEDISMLVDLKDAQAMLGMEGRINQILALGCNCAGSDLAGIRKQVASVLPDTRVTEFQSMALARAEQRKRVGESRDVSQRQYEMLAAVITPIVVLAAAIWVGLLALVNVRQRTTEIGILRAIGKGSGTIAFLFLGKAVLLGLLGGAVGFILGSLLSWQLGLRVFEFPTEQFSVSLLMLGVALIGAPLVSAIASYLPTLAAITQDPAVVLRDQ